MREIFFGEDEDEFEEGVALYLAEFLQVYAHEIVYAYRRSFPRLRFRSRTYDGVAVHQCTEPKISDYVEKTRKTLTRWIRRRKLTGFTVIVSNRPDHPAMGDEPNKPTVCFQHQVRITQLLEALSSNATGEREFVEETVQQMEELKAEIRKVLFELQSWSVSHEFVYDTPLYLELVCSLKPGMRVRSYGTEEHSWKRIRRPPPAVVENSGTSRLTSASHNVDCEIAKIHFIQIDLCRRAP